MSIGDFFIFVRSGFRIRFTSSNNSWKKVASIRDCPDEDLSAQNFFRSGW